MANQSNGASAISRAVRILDAFTFESPFLTLSAIAERSGIPLSSAQRIIGELVAQQLLERMPDRSYRIGNRMWEIGTRTPGALGLRGIALPYLHAIQSRVRQHVQLVVRADLDALVIERISARDAVVNASLIGGHIPLQYSSAGIVLLAAGEEGLIERVLARGLEPITDTGLRNETELWSAVEFARREGYAVAAGFIFAGSRGIAVPIHGSLGATVGAVGIVDANDGSSPMRHVTLLRRAAQGISEALLRSYLPPEHPQASPGGSYRSLVSSSELSMEVLDTLIPRLEEKAKAARRG
ncbi:IclR family transcriptional regulator [soil metagenome]